MALVLISAAYQIDDEIDNPLSILEILTRELPAAEGMTPIKVWGSSHPNNEVRCAELHAQNLKAQSDPEFGWTVQGRKLQEKALSEAASEVADQVIENQKESRN